MQQTEMEAAVQKVEAQLAASETKQTELETTNKRLAQIIALSAEDRKVFDRIGDVKKQDDFLAADAPARANIAKAMGDEDDDEEDDDDPVLAKRLADIEKKHQEEVEALTKRVEASENVAKAHIAKAEQIEFEKRAGDELGNFPGTVQEKAKVLSAVCKALKGEDLEGVLKLFKAGNEAFAQLGKASSSDRKVGLSKGSAEQKLDQATAEIRKNNPSMTEAQAFAKAMTDNPDLYTQYLAENPEQTQ